MVGKKGKEPTNLAAERARRKPTRLKPPRSPISEQALANTFVERHGHELRFVPAWNKWMRWDGSCWREDQIYMAWRLARGVIFEASQHCETVAQDHRVNSAKTEAAAVTLAAKDQRIVATVDQWDAHSLLLGTPGRTVDLATMTMCEPRPEDYLTMSTAVTPDESVPIPLWLNFLSKIMGGDESMVAYLRRVLGYSLTGLTREHVMFFKYGTGRNGKGVLLNTAAGILGNYAVTAAAETFTASQFDRHSTELAMLRGARLVSASETEAGRPWAERRIKEVTGGDPISARFMRQDFFSFVPAFKLIISGNHKPTIVSPDVAIRSRIHLVPFTVTIPEDERDPDLAAKLKAEWPGILAWMIEGTSDYFECGLAPPEKVTEATADYLDEEDAVLRWLDAQCDRDPQATAKSGELFDSWKAWAVANNEPAGSSKAFAASLIGHGFRRGPKSNGHPTFRGIQIRPGPTMQPWERRD